MPEVLTVRTGTLEIGYEAHGDAGGVPVVLLHGFPDDARAFDDVAPPLAAAGCRVLVPYLRGYGPTRFLDPREPRMAQQAAIGRDLLEFVEALALPPAALAGYDWGGRAACIAAILAPERVRALVTIGGYNVQNTVTPAPPALVSVVLQHRARAAGPRAEPPRSLPASLGRMVADLAIRFGDVRPHGAVLRQSRLRGGGDPLLPSPSRQRAGRWAPGRDRAAPRGAPGDHRAHRDPSRRR